MSDDPRLREAEEALRDALRVEPSQALVARVRADASAARPRRVAVWLGAVAAVLLVGAVAALVLGRAPDVQGPKHVASSGGPDATAPAPAGTAPKTPPEPSREAQVFSPAAPSISIRPVVSGARLRPAARPSIEVIVPPGQVEALARLVESVSAGEIGPPRSLLDSPGLATSLLEPAPLVVQPLEIAPIEPSPALSPIGRGDS